MIKIEKGKAPEFLSSEKVEIARERMRTKYFTENAVTVKQ